MPMKPVKFLLTDEGFPSDDSPYACHIELRRQMDGSEKWAVTSLGNVLNKRGTWEHEPMPSSRSDAFLTRTRFNCIADAYEATKKIRWK
jgi:hypothetical protein